MRVDVLNLEGKKVSTAEMAAVIFEAPIKPDLMHQALVRQLANARLGTHSTKSRGEVSGGGRKPWRQKGTGRARVGSTRSPIWVGGGSALIILPAADEGVARSVRNLAQAKTLRAEYLNIRDILGFDRLLLPLGAVDVIQTYLG